ncbi:lysyl oxidase family protein [Lentzea sp. HUAS TT2]|uniref:lysyl oxidase family protein n=1 Tax=Lentzea sp. HUAS TT2 TaxID=3447454 RepID=UPI003F71DAE3
MAITVALVPQAQADERPLLPDLRQAPVGCTGGYGGDPSLCRDWDVCMVTNAKSPNGDCVTSGAIQAVRLRFTTAEDNVGEGPLLLYGRRPDRSSTDMEVRQAFQTGWGGAIPGSYDDAERATATSMYYEPARMHMHWHLMGFARMQLLTPGGETVVADRKNGFCLGDRYRTADADTLPASVRDTASPEGQLAQRLERNRCGHRDPHATEVFEGISVGSGDDYRFNVDFQWLDLTNVPSGTYDVVNTVNSDRTLVESSYNNNSSSISISVQWPNGAATRPSVITEAPAVTLLRSCPGQERCAAATKAGTGSVARQNDRGLGRLPNPPLTRSAVRGRSGPIRTPGPATGRNGCSSVTSARGCCCCGSANAP